MSAPCQNSKTVSPHRKYVKLHISLKFHMRLEPPQCRTEIERLFVNSSHQYIETQSSNRPITHVTHLLRRNKQNTATQVRAIAPARDFLLFSAVMHSPHVYVFFFACKAAWLFFGAIFPQMRPLASFVRQVMNRQFPQRNEFTSASDFGICFG